MKDVRSLALRFATATLLVAPGLFLGCQGDQGPAGRDGTSIDTVPPTIALVAPTASETYRDSILVSANATDNVGVERVIFYLDGSEQIDDSSYTIITDPPYSYSYDIDQLALTDGPHTLVARAVDQTGNIADSPVLLFYTELRPQLGAAVLRSSNPDSVDAILLPNRFEAGSPILLDSLYNVRFSPDRRARIDSVRFWLDSLFAADMVYDCSLRVSLHPSNGVYPGDPIESVLYDADSLEAVGWQTVRFSSEHVYQAGDRFHISVSPVNPSDSTRLGFGVGVLPRYDFPTDNLSGLWSMESEPAQWLTVQESALAPANWTYEFRIETWVEYIE